MKRLLLILLLLPVFVAGQIPIDSFYVPGAQWTEVATTTLLPCSTGPTEVSDVLGRILYKKSILFESGNYKLRIDNLVPGMYMMQLTDIKARKFMFKFVKE